MFYKKRIERVENDIAKAFDVVSENNEKYAKAIIQMREKISSLEKQIEEQDKVLQNHADVLRKAKESYIALKEDKDKCNERIESLEKQIEELKVGLIRENTEKQASALQMWDEYLNGAKQ